MKPHLQIFALILAVFNGLAVTGVIAQNSDFYGMTPTGGNNNTGAIFKTDGNGNNFEVIFSFPPSWPHGHIGPLLVAGNGRIYGITLWGGAYEAGVLYEWDPVTGIFAKKIDFEGGENGGYPTDLVQAGNGKIYLFTGGGEFNMGTISEWDPVTNTLAKKLDFNGTDNGRDPHGFLSDIINEKLYGSTSYGGVNDAGIFFEWDPETSTFTKKLDFDSLSGYNSGYFFQDQNGRLYTVSNVGEVNTLFEWDPDSNVYSKVFDFGVKENGIGLTGSLIQAGNGKLYGMAQGGIYNGGVLFELDLDSSRYTKLLDLSVENGVGPQGSLVEADNGKLYGMTTSGGTKGMGVLFELDPVTNSYTKKMDFTGTENGRLPIGSLIKANNGKLFGKTWEGGAYNFGVLFEWDPATDTYTKKLDFKGTENGRFPTGRMVQAKNGNLYGTTEAGGLYEKGILFKLDPATDAFAKILDFNGTENGWGPTGYMIEADNGNLYGLTQMGDAGYDSLHPNFENGVLFEFNPTTEILTKKVDFNGFEKGSLPVESLAKAKSGKLYGMTWSGGAFDEWFNLGYGVLFEYDPVNDIYTKKMDFNPFQNDGFAPNASLIQADNGKLYGTTPIGGAYEDENYWGNGVLFEWDPATDTYTKMKVFNQAEDGISPSNTMVQAGNGKLYGATSGGGLYTHTEPVGEVTNGVFYEWDPATSTYTKKLDLNESETGFSPVGPFLQAENGKLYGMNSQGGAYNRGVFFEWDPKTNIFSKKLDLGGNELLTTSPKSLLYQEKNKINEIHEKKGINNTGYNVELNGFDGTNYSGGLVEVKHSVTDQETNAFKSKITVYPNPTEGSFKIDLGKTYPDAEITITQLDGRVIHQEHILNARFKYLQLSESPGLYMVSIISGDEKAVFKISKLW